MHKSTTCIHSGSFKPIINSDVFLALSCFFLLLSSRLSKSEEDKIELKATLDSVQKEGLKIN